MILTRTFRAMGTDVELFLAADPGSASDAALHAAEREFERVEALLSRFRPDSELSALNRDGHVAAGEDLLTVVELALEARERTNGRFDPTVHDALVGAGYDRTFEEVAREGASSGGGGRCGGEVTVDRARGSIRLEPGIHVDLGGIGKGYTVDRAAAILSSAGPALVDAGGDIAALGRPDALGWRVGIETAEDTLTLALEDAAVATSGRDRRHWRRDGEERHHLIDPSTGRPADADLVRVTVVERTAVEADVLAKSLFLAGEAGATAEATALGLPCVLVTADGRTVIAGGLS
ncbi:MAG TPA: FAD:protein FMN transferase [Solirubrobacteraceae bacterium]|nr:FAD:protein FMN transferase [Solirubrobacteraceae bacterium]